MSPFTEITGILAALLLGAMSPGPSFVVVAGNAVSSSRRNALASAIGIGAGGVAFSCVALGGLYTVLTTLGWLNTGLKLLGGLYLLFMAYKIWRGATVPFAMNSSGRQKPQGTMKSFSIGLTTHISNPKAAIVYGSIFAALLPPTPPTWVYLALPPLVFVVEAGWFVIVALSFSSSGPRALYLGAKTSVDRIAATAIAMLGIRLIFTSRAIGL
jgi:threonine/homoserine/homoserine lactone efflux protein